MLAGSLHNKRVQAQLQQTAAPCTQSFIILKNAHALEFYYLIKPCVTYYDPPRITTAALVLQEIIHECSRAI